MKKIPTYIISGFLGSGKTTLLLHLLKYCKSQKKKAAILLNELGSVNVENHLFEDENVFELLDGCICCSIQEDLKATLTTLVEAHMEKPIDVLFVEGTGVANPLEIVEVIASPPFVNSFDIQSVISMIDANAYLDNQDIFTSKTIRDLLKNQIKGATVVVLNKVDLVKEKQLQKIEVKISKLLDTNTPVIKTSYGNVDLIQLLQKRSNTTVFSHQHQTNCCGDSLHSSCNHHKHHHDHVQHTSIKTITFQDVPSVTKRQLKKWLKSLPEGIMRGKGYIYLQDKPGLYPFQYSSNQVHIGDFPLKITLDPCMVLIGKDIDIMTIQDSYASQFSLS
ncbi:GTP-binding protein [Neobacillus cucumis]|uniref:CobW family GTP-binding protein n=1 Tax=Neobacillus cucumis TaxID=1740721 RepID=UPI002041483F|nr:GTP-binding protein [Neobacillus cucumis]MCM3725827.1 GTP-binding protein [Neobacillus cucumis]